MRTAADFKTETRKIMATRLARVSAALAFARHDLHRDWQRWTRTERQLAVAIALAALTVLFLAPAGFARHAALDATSGLSGSSFAATRLSPASVKS
jgi:hypothetical protein